MWYWSSVFYEEPKEQYSLHPNSPILWLVSKIIEIFYFFNKNFFKNYLTYLKIPKIVSSLSISDLPNMKRLGQVVLARNEQENLKPALNKGTRNSNLIIFSTDCRHFLIVFHCALACCYRNIKTDKRYFW